MKKQKKEMKENVGITLIALVVTIIVLLMLAGVSISMLTGDNSILNQAASTKEATETSGIEEKIKLAAIGAMTNVSITISEDDLKSELDSYFGSSGYTISGNSTSGWTVTVNGVSYLITSRGNVSTSGASTDVDWDTILANLADSDARESYLAEATALGQDSTNSDVGIGTDGSVVNLDLWGYYRTNDGESMRIGGSSNGSGTLTVPTGSGYTAGSYDNANIQSDGTIQGTIPQYIYYYATDTIYPVTYIEGIFYGCTSLTTAPEIPTTVISMGLAFAGCTSLTTAPEIPDSVTDMSYAFWNCTSLTVASEIPDSVTNMNSTFCNCTSLTTVPSIGSSVNIMIYTFSGCSSLTGTMTINANPTSITEAFYYSATNDTCKLYLTGSSTMLIDFIKTKSSSDSKIYLYVDESNLIEFTLDGETCYAESGMTWGEWFYCDLYSGPELLAGTGASDGGDGELCFSDYNNYYGHVRKTEYGTNYVLFDETIEEGTSYYTIITQ